MVLEAVAALIGTAIGAGVAVAARGNARPWALVLAVIGAVAGLTGAPGPLVSMAAATAAAASLVDLRWRFRPEPAHRLSKRWDRTTVRRVVAAETLGTPFWAVPAMAVAVALGTAAGRSPTMAAAVTVVPIAAWLRGRGGGALSAFESSTDGAGRVEMIADDSTDRKLFEGVVDDLAGRGHSAAVAVSPPHMFRGLAGWNLGLGLDAEQAAWAGQLARSVGLEGLLAQPERDIGLVEARKLAVCRALASAGDVVVLDEPVAGMEPHDVKLVAAVVERALAGRRLIVVTGDVAGHLAFVSKVRSRT